MSAPILKANRRIKTLPEFDWVEIPVGEFIFGREEKHNEATLFLETFHISRYPITNIQYQTFIDDGGYQNERWWQDLKKPDAEESQWHHANRPRTDVNWYEAVAFCRWLSAQRNYKIQLPSEQQWEKAAHGL